MASTIKVDKIEGSTGTTVTVPTGQTFTVTDGLAIGSIPTITVAKGGTNTTSYTAGDVLYASGATTLTKLAKGTAEQVLSMNSGETAPEWTTAAPTAGGTGQTAWAVGDLLYANGVNTLTKLTKPGSTQLLQMTSAGVPSWVDAAGGAWTKISTISGNDVITEADFATLSTDYIDFKVIGTNVVPGTDNQDMHFRYSVSSSFLTSNYQIIRTGGDETGAVVTAGSGSAATLNLNYNGCGGAAGENVNFELTIYDPHDTVNFKIISYKFSYVAGNTYLSTLRGAGMNEGNTAAVDGLRFYFAAGTIKSGEITLYGRKIT